MEQKLYYDIEITNVTQSFFTTMFCHIISSEREMNTICLVNIHAIVFYFVLLVFSLGLWDLSTHIIWSCFTGTMASIHEEGAVLLV